MTTAGRKILVTGGCGFIGAAAAEAFADAGHRVSALDIEPRRFRNDVKFIRQDIADAPGLVKALEGVDSVIHCAALVHTKKSDGERIWAVNHGGTLNVLDACETLNVSRLVHLSSASVVFNGADIEYADERMPYPESPSTPYAQSKIAAEKAVLEFAKRGSTRACVLRPHLVFGPGDNRLVQNILDRASAGRGLREIGNREKLSDFTYISNLTDAILAAESAMRTGSTACGQACFVTNGEPKPFFEFVEDLLAALDRPRSLGKTPFWLAYAWAAIVETIHAVASRGAPREDGISRHAVKYLATHHYFNIDKARRSFGWTPNVSLAEGVRLTAQALRAKSVEAPR